MSYATLDQFKLRLGDDFYAELTDRDEGSTADDTVGQSILDGAHGTINGYLAKRYAIPVNAIGDASLTHFLKKHELNLAEYDAWQANPFRNSIQERVKEGYAETVRLLREIAAGKTELPGAEPIPAATASGPSAIATGHTRIFDEDALEGL